MRLFTNTDADADLGGKPQGASESVEPARRCATVFEVLIQKRQAEVQIGAVVEGPNESRAPADGKPVRGIRSGIALSEGGNPCADICEQALTPCWKRDAGFHEETARNQCAVLEQVARILTTDSDRSDPMLADGRDPVQANLWLDSDAGDVGIVGRHERGEGRGLNGQRLPCLCLQGRGTGQENETSQQA